MPHPRWQRIKELFAAASALPPDQREAMLRALPDDADLIAEVHSLLAAHSPTLAPDATPGATAEGPGSRIGPYKLLEAIGEGGFGTVYAAEQEAPVRRRVALKVVKAGMDSKAVIARFEQERQALALMDHPNIARVFDGGATASGRPFFVMELVKGDPITEYCDREKLTPAERLRLFADVGRAVQHAHTKGVIHRDLKPNNVLVTIVDGKPVAKVIDFGVAKATQGRLTDKTLFTEHKQMIGTPLYMSPEQAHISGVDVDTRSDVYSLGVLLYELLTGTTPFRREELLDAGLAEMHRVLREVEPPKPSTRVATLGKTSGVVAAQRRVEVGKLGVMLRGDLDWIVMKCLEKERARRYETASALVQDVERHLGGEAVEAAPPSVAYRVRKFVRRRKGQVAAVAAVVVAIAAGGALALWQTAARASEAQLASAREEVLAEAKEFHSYASHIQAANAARLQNDSTAMLRHLEACPPHLRNWEWKHLHSLADRSIDTILDRRPNYDLDNERQMHRDWNTETAGLWGRESRTAIPLANSGNREGELCAIAVPGGYRIAFHRPVDGRPRVEVFETTAAGTQLLTTLHPTFDLPRDHEERPQGDDSLEYEIDGCFVPGGHWMVTMVWPYTEPAPNRHEVWDTKSWRRASELPPESGSLAFSDDGTLAAVEQADGDILVLRATDWTPVDHLQSSLGDVTTLRFGHQNRLLAATDQDGYCCLWDVGRATLLSQIAPIGAALAYDACFTPDGSHAVIGSSDGSTGIWSIRENAWSGRLVGHLGPVLGVDCSSDGRLVATASRDKTVRIWDLATRSSTVTLLGHTDPCHTPRFEPGGHYLVTNGQNCRRIWSAASWQRSASPIEVTRPGDHMAIEPVGPLQPGEVWFTADSRELHTEDFALDAATGSVLSRASAIGRWSKGRSGESGVLTWHSGDSREPLSLVLETAGENGELQWRIRVENPLSGTGHPFGEWQPGMLIDFSVAQDGRCAGLHQNGTLMICDQGPDPTWRVLRSDPSAEAVDMSTHGRQLAILGTAPRIVDLTSVQADLLLQIPVGVQEGAARFASKNGVATTLTKVGWSPTGRYFACASLAARAVVVWRADDGSLACVLDGFDEAITTATFSPDESRIAACAADGTIRLWDLPSGRDVVEFAVSAYEIVRLAFSPDGSCLAAIDDSGACHILNTADSRLADTAFASSQQLGEKHREATRALLMRDSWHPDDDALRAHLDSLPFGDRRAVAAQIQQAYETRRLAVRTQIRTLLEPQTTADEATRLQTIIEQEAKAYPGSRGSTFWKGLALYRQSQFTQALATIQTRLDEDEARIVGAPTILDALRVRLAAIFERDAGFNALLLMLHCRLGNREEAVRLRPMLTQPLQREAEELFAATFPTPEATNGR